MYIHWKTLTSIGIVFWGVLCLTDLFGESSWKRHSEHLSDVLSGYRELIKIQTLENPEGVESSKDDSKWSGIMWNMSAFVCSLIFCSVIKSTSWVMWRILKVFNVFRTKKPDKVSGKVSDHEVSEGGEGKTKVLFKNQMFKTDKRQEALSQDNSNLTKQLEELKKEKTNLAQQLVLAQKENLTARQQIEEYKLETFMMKEKLARTTNSLKENLKYKDFASQNQEMIARKAHNLEVHLKEVGKDRELLRNKLSILEKNYSKLEERLKQYDQERQESESNNEQVPEKDLQQIPMNNENNELEEDLPEPDVDMSKFQKKIMELQRSIGNFDTKKVHNHFEANSKISMDLEDSSLETPKENSSEMNDDKTIPNINPKKTDINLVKQNLLNYNAYKVQMLRPKLNVSNTKQKDTSRGTDTSGSSSDETNGPHRIISSTVEFQNFLKNLNTRSASNINFTGSMF